MLAFSRLSLLFSVATLVTVAACTETIHTSGSSGGGPAPTVDGETPGDTAQPGDTGQPGADAGSSGTGSSRSVAADLAWKLLPAASRYDSRVSQVSGSSLDSTAAGYAQAGFVVTAVTTNGAGYTLFGFKPSSAATTYAARVEQVSGSSLDSVSSSYAQAGFVVTAVTTNGAGYTLFGFKPSSASSARTFVCASDQTTDPPTPTPHSNAAARAAPGRSR